MQLTSDGEVRTATVNIRVGHGSLRLPALPEAPLEVDGGSINVAYDGVAGEGHAGAVDAELARQPHHDFRRRRSRAGQCASIRHGRISCVPAKARSPPRNSTFPRLRSMSWYANGRILPHRGEVELADFKLRAGGAEVALSGNLVAGVAARQHAARRHAQPDAAQHAEGAVAEGHRAGRARVGGRARASRVDPRRQVPLPQRRSHGAGSERPARRSLSSRSSWTRPISRCRSSTICRRSPCRAP